MNRASGRLTNQLRRVNIIRNFTRYAEGSVLIEFGDTKVICNASVENNVPSFLRGQGSGWVTAEYAMLPRSTNTRMPRESVKGKQSGRTVEIQRLIGRCLRAALDLNALGENTITVDCEVIQADGGTRTASITGAYIALVDAVNYLLVTEKLSGSPLRRMIASVSVGIYKGVPVLDLDYVEDSGADTDMNVVIADDGGIIELQGTAEREPFSEEEFGSMLLLAKQGISELHRLQKEALSSTTGSTI